MAYQDLPPTELIRKCLDDGTGTAWEEFVRRFQPVIATAVRRTAIRFGEMSSSFVDDLVQETFLKICADNRRILRELQPHAPNAVYGFLKVVAVNLVRDHFKSLRSDRRGGGRVEQFDDSPGSHGAQAGNADVAERIVLLGQIDAILSRKLTGATKQRDRLVFWLYYKVGLSAAAIASFPAMALTAKGVESLLLRLTRSIREELVQSASGPAPGAPKEGISSTESF